MSRLVFSASFKYLNTYVVGLRPLYIILILSVRGPSLYVRIYRRQIMTYKDGPHAERIKVYAMSSVSGFISKYDGGGE